MLGLGGVVAGLASLVSWRLGASAASLMGVSAGLVAPLAGLAIGLVAGAGVLRLRDSWMASRQRAQDLEQRITALERTRQQSPAPHIRFDYNRQAQRVRLHVTNHGAEAEFQALLTIDGGLSAPLDVGACATWEHTDRPRTSIPRGETRTLCLARLDLSTFPFAQWEVCASFERAPLATLRALHTNVIGGVPQEHAPTIFLEITLVSAPATTDGLRTCLIALHPFEAQRLRPY